MVIVLSCVALLSLLALGMMGSASFVRSSATATAEADAAQLLADTAVQVALAQLRTGTESDGSHGAAAPWTSQPGQITIHKLNGAPDHRVRLYSAPEMITRGDAADPDPPAWTAMKGQYADINAPILHSGGGLAFPVADPRAAVAGPAGPPVEGFSIDLRRAPDGTGVAATEGSLPMPVHWIYQLEDGTCGTLDDSGAFVSGGQSRPGPANRITGRFAFWTDDESCKVNVNTASEGVFWDTPRADTEQERALAAFQPLGWEYHRQPGHPSAVCLSSVLAPGRRFHPQGFPGSEAARAGKLTAMRSADFLWLLQLGRQAAGFSWEGTSVGGTAAAGFFSPQLSPGLPLPRSGDIHDLTWDASPADEGSRAVASWFRGRDDRRAALAGRQFFLTTRNAAPETTLADTPRIALWPIHATVADGTAVPAGPLQRSTAYDHAVAAAARVGSRTYCVQRTRPGDGFFDFQAAGGGANAALLGYLRGITERPVPGFYRPGEGMRTFADKYGSGPRSDREGMLLGMLDYLRAANFSDGQLAAESQFPVLCPANAHEGFGQVTPLQTAPPGADGLRGMGRMLTVSEVALFMICRAEVRPDGSIRGNPSSMNRSALTLPGQREIEVGLLLEAFVPSHGWADYRPYVSIALAGGEPQALPDSPGPWPDMYLNGMPLVPAVSRPHAQSPADPPAQWISWGGHAGFRCLSQRLIQFRPVVVGAAKDGGLAALDFSGTDLPGNIGRRFKLAVYDHPGSAASGTSGRGDLVQLIGLEFPPIRSSIRLPELPQIIGSAGLTERVLAATRRAQPLLQPGDVVQSLVPHHGDYRVVAMRSHHDTGEARPLLFRPHPDWGRRAQAHSLCEPSLHSAEGTASGRTGGYFPDLPVPADSAADWCGVPGSGPQVTGDFDNGVAGAPDGPYSNRPDDGHLQPLAGGGVPYFSVAAAGMAVPPVSAAVFSAHRQIPSAVMFGSLPVRPASGTPWQTLLFRPQPGHPGAAQLPDYLLADNFWQPVVEPHPVSLHLETEGRVNLNHEIVPFGWITRRTALHAVFKPETIMAIPDHAAATYKNGRSPEDRFRHFIDTEATLRLWETMRGRKPFLTAAEICSLPLVPEGYSGELSSEALAAWWQRHRLTGDNSRERPYARLLPHFTARSNVFRVHFIAESIKGSGHHTYHPERDRITSQRRGSCRIQRQLDTCDPSIPDFAGSGAASASLRHHYRWQIGDWRMVRGFAGAL